jgi:uncharacterized membrane protein
MTSNLDSPSARRDRKYWVTPATGVVVGLLYLIGFSIGGQPVLGMVALAVMVVFSAGLVLLGRRSETVHGLLSRRDERIASMDLRATAVTAVVMILVCLAGFVIQVARGHSGRPYDLIAAVGGVAYIGSLVWFRLRG